MNKILINSNLHTHSDFCDGVGSLNEYVEQAIKLNFQQLGFSSHAPLMFDNNFSIKEEQLQNYIDNIQLLKINNASQISIFSGLECDYIPSFSYPFSLFKNKYNFDYLIGGVHLVENIETKQLWFIDGSKKETFDKGLLDVFGGDIKKAVTAYFNQLKQMIDSQSFEILAHFDKIKMHNAGRYFSENDDWYKKLCLEVIELIADKKIIVEVNTRGIYKGRCPDFYPSDFILKKLLENKIGIVINSDAHHPKEIGLMLEEAKRHIIEIGFKEVWCFNNLGKLSPISL